MATWTRVLQAASRLKSRAAVTITMAPYSLSEDLCLDPITAVFSGTCTIQHGSGNAFSGVFNGQFVPSGQILEVHATWRAKKGSGIFSNAIGAGTGKGVATIVNGAPGPGSPFLDGNLILPNC